MIRESLKVLIPTNTDIVLSGVLEVSEHPLMYAAKPVVGIISHCFTCTKDMFVPTRTTKRLAEIGITCLRFDFTGLGGSTGDFGETNLTTNIQDINFAAKFLESKGYSVQILIGHSFGGIAAIYAASILPSVQLVATVCSPSGVDHLVRRFQEHEAEFTEHGEATVLIEGRPFRFKTQFVQDLKTYNVPDGVAALKAHLHVVHAADDTIVKVNRADDYMAMKGHSAKTKFIIEGADHFLSNRMYTEALGDNIFDIYQHLPKGV